MVALARVTTARHGRAGRLLNLQTGEAYDPCLVSSLQWLPLTARGTLVTGPIHSLVMEDLCSYALVRL